VSSGGNEDVPEQIVHLVRRIARELGDAPLLFPPIESASRLPAPLLPLYTFSDGIELPFLRFARTDEIHELTHHHLFGEHWLWFGEDFGFTDYLCRYDSPAAELPIASWDRESDTPIEGTQAGILDLLREEYSRFVENELNVADLHLTEIPEGANAMQVVRAIRSLHSNWGAGLSADLRDLPLVLESVACDIAIAAVRAIHAAGAGACLRNVRPRSAG
jgi:hypothetical protein